MATRVNHLRIDDGAQDMLAGTSDYEIEKLRKDLLYYKSRLESAEIQASKANLDTLTQALEWYARNARVQAYDVETDGEEVKRVIPVEFDWTDRAKTALRAIQTPYTGPHK